MFIGIKNNYKNVIGKASNLDFNEALFADCDLPPTLVEGCKVKYFGRSDIQPQYAILDQGMNCIAEDDFTMIIINDNPAGYSMMVLKDLIKCKCLNIIAALTIDISLQVIERPRPLYHCDAHSSPQDQVLRWIKDDREQDLVTSFDMIRGFENDIIVDTVGDSAVSSRVSGQLIKISSNSFLDMYCVYEGILKGYHNCERILNRQSRKKIIPDILAVIGKLIKDVMRNHLLIRVQSRQLLFHETQKIPTLKIL